MLSRAERRRAIERAWRTLALAMLAWAVVAAFRERTGRAEEMDGAALATELPRLTRAATPAQLGVALHRAPAASERAWLAALRRAGGRIEWWSVANIPPLALEVIPRADPAGGVRALVAAPRGATVQLADAAGPLDTLVTTAPVATRRLPTFVAPLRARVREQDAIAAPRDALASRRVYVLGNASWEGKFVVAVLEERGWLASASFDVAPQIAITQGEPLTLDTANFAAVIVLDSAAALGETRLVATFVRQGGGLIVSGDAARMRPFSSLAPGTVGPRVRATSLAFTDSAPRRALGFDAITRLKADAIVLDSRDGHVAVAARRAGAGRVIQVGYDDTWRWRFGGGARAAEAHRAWWSDLVSSVSYRAALPIPNSCSCDPAPFASLISALGPSAERRAPRPDVPLLPWWLFAIIAASLLAEIASRRLRGAP